MSELDERLRLQRERANLAEKHVLGLERERLRAAGLGELAGEVIRVSLDDVAAGFDILFFEITGTPRHVEVKSSAGPRLPLCPHPERVPDSPGVPELVRARVGGRGVEFARRAVRGRVVPGPGGYFGHRAPCLACLRRRSRRPPGRGRQHVPGRPTVLSPTGWRPGEACAVRRCDLDTGGPTWLYKPPQHKTAHRGKARVIAIGPKAQALLRQFFTPDIAGYLFSPRRAVAEFHAERSANRRTPRYPSHTARNDGKRVTGSKRRLAERYDRGSYGLAIDRACDKAFPPPGELARREGETRKAWWGRLTPAQRAEVAAWRKAHRWHPNQLRHSFATWVRRQYGLEAAQVLLGHAKADVTRVYAERHERLAASVVAKIG